MHRAEPDRRLAYSGSLYMHTFNVWTQRTYIHILNVERTVDSGIDNLQSTILSPRMINRLTEGAQPLQLHLSIISKLIEHLVTIDA